MFNVGDIVTLDITHPEVKDWPAFAKLDCSNKCIVVANGIYNGEECIYIYIPAIKDNGHTYSGKVQEKYYHYYVYADRFKLAEPHQMMFSFMYE